MNIFGHIVATIALVALCIGVVVCLGRFFYIIAIDELWARHGWKLFRHPTLKPGARVIIVVPAWRGWAHCAGKLGTIEKQVYRDIWNVLVDGESEVHRYHIEEMELVPPSAKAYEELFL